MPCHDGGPDKNDYLTQIMCMLSDVISKNDDAFTAAVMSAELNDFPRTRWCKREEAIRHVLKHRQWERRENFLRECSIKAPNEIVTGSEKTYIDEYGNSFRFVRRGKRGLLWTVFDAVTGKEER